MRIDIEIIETSTGSIPAIGDRLEIADGHTGVVTEVGPYWVEVDCDY